MRFLACLLLLCTAGSALAADTRHPVTMPTLQRELIRADMVAHLATLQQVQELLADNKLQEAATLAENELGVSSMGKNAAKSQGKGPGQFMPPEMRAIALGMHRDASDFAKIAQQGDRTAAYRALLKVSGACISCHASYRIE
ncbi:MAG: hypothetical protein Fur0026_09720 [Sideroxydans sp.]